MKPAALLIGLITIAIITVGILVSAFLIMFLVNVVIGHYDGKPLDYPTSIAIAILFSMVMGAIRTAMSKD